jgi:hypothetical protein
MSRQTDVTDDIKFLFGKMCNDSGATPADVATWLKSNGPSNPLTAPQYVNDWFDERIDDPNRPSSNNHWPTNVGTCGTAYYDHMAAAIQTLIDGSEPNPQTDPDGSCAWRWFKDQWDPREGGGDACDPPQGTPVATGIGRAPAPVRNWLKPKKPANSSGSRRASDLKPDVPNRSTSPSTQSPR